MVQIPLTEGSYEAKSIVANSQRCVNLYPEMNTQDAPFPFTLYTTPGLVQLWRLTYARDTGPAYAGRGIYRTSLNGLYAVIGQDVYYYIPASDAEIAFSLEGIKIGSIGSVGRPIQMYDNGTTMFIVDGTDVYYRVNINPEATDEDGNLIPFNQFTASNNDAYYGSDTISYLDGFAIFNRPGTRQFYITDFLSDNLDSLQFASKISDSDLLVGCAATKQLLYLFGQNTTEIWYNSGDLFPFARTPGALINYGCLTPNSLCESDGSVYFLSRSPNGHCLVMRTIGYDVQRISTYAIENEISSYPDPSDCVSYIYQQNGHTFYVMNFTTGNKTWVFDSSTNKWHERAYLNRDGTLSRQIQGFHAFYNGRHIVLDYNAAFIYEMTQSAVLDDDREILRIRSFPHMVSNGNRVKYNRFQLSAQYATNGDAYIDGGNINPPSPPIPVKTLNGIITYGDVFSAGAYSPILKAFKRVDNANYSLVDTLTLPVSTSYHSNAQDISPDGKLIAMTMSNASNTGGVRLIRRLGNGDSITLTDLGNVSGLSLSCSGVSFNPVSNYMAVMGWDGTNTYINIYIVSGVTVVFLNQTVLSSFQNDAGICKFSPDGTMLLCINSSTSSLKLFNFNLGVLTPGTIPNSPPAFPSSLEFGPNSDYVVITGGTGGNTLTLYSLAGGVATLVSSPVTASPYTPPIISKTDVLSVASTVPNAQYSTRLCDKVTGLGSIIETYAIVSSGGGFNSSQRFTYNNDYLYLAVTTAGVGSGFTVTGTGGSTDVEPDAGFVTFGGYNTGANESMINFDLLQRI